MISTKLSKFNLCIVRFPGPIPSFEAYREVAETVKYGLQAIGYDAIISDDKLMYNSVNIIFGFQILAPEMLPMLSGSTIFYNLEKMSSTDNFTDSDQYQPIMYEIKSKVPVWDYNLANCDIHRRLGITNVVHVPIGYMPEMRRIEPAVEQDIDVLFYGGVNERRRKVLQDLKDAGLKVTALHNVWGIERDKYIARSKVVLNMHLYLAHTFEIVRISYLLANSKAVVSEYCESTSIESDLLDALVLADYKDLVPACLDLVNDHKKRRFYEERVFSVMSARDETIYLNAALSQTFNLTVH
jgi:hypothetical protein